MNLVCAGLSFHTAPVELRERAAFSPADLRSALDRLAGPARQEAVLEAVLLSTCNRTEMYAVVDAPDAAADVGAFLVARAGLPTGSVEPHLYTHVDAAAVRHLFRVAAGLDSMIVGETEILGQVRQAIAEARATGAAGTVLGALFTAAQRTGRRARAETGIGNRAASAASAAVELAGATVGALAGKHIALVGAGQVGVLVAKALVAQGARGFVVSNRSYERAVDLANAWSGCAVTFDRLVEILADTDVAICSTSASHAVVRAVDVAAAMDRRPGRPLTLIDLAVPRDVEPDAAAVPGVALFDIDDLRDTVADNLAERSAAVPEVEAIVATETERFTRWLATLDVTPTIAALRRWADGVRAAEVRRAMRRLGDLDERERATVEAMAEAIVAKLLHPPITQLRRRADGPGRYRESEIVREVFGLDEAPPAGNGLTEPDRDSAYRSHNTARHDRRSTP